MREAWSARISSQYLRESQHGLTYLAQTDAGCGLSCHQFRNVGYGGTHGGAKVAGDPGEAGRWANIRQLGVLLFSLWTQPNTARSASEASASSDPGGFVFDPNSQFICSHVHASFCTGLMNKMRNTCFFYSDSYSSIYYILQ